MVKKRKISPDELKEILQLHKEWLVSDGMGGVRADLCSADLREADLREADLSKADLRKARLYKANLCKANFYGTNLSAADLQLADLSNASLIGIDLNKSSLADTIFRSITIDEFSTKQIPQGLQQKYSKTWNIIKFMQNSFGKPRIERSIEFPPEYHQAGISILNYFGTVLRDKYPDKKAKVKIEQDGLKVTMIIESEEGDIETIEKLLDNYGLVIHGKMPPDELCENKYEILKLENKLELATVEIKMLNKTIGLQEKEREYKSANIDKLLDLVSLAIQNTGNKTTTIDITGETVAIGQGATATTIISKYEDNKEKIDKALEEFKNEVSEEIQQQISDLTEALMAALKDKDEKAASGVWENIKKVFTATEKTVKTSEKAAKLFLNAVDLLDKL